MTAHLADTPVLETERLRLRAPEAADLEAYAPFVMSARARFIGGGADKDMGHAWRMLSVLSGHWHLRGYGTFVMVENASGRPVGSAGPWHPGDWPEPELGWSIWSEDAEGRGYAFEAVTELRRHAYGRLGWSTAVSYIDARNARSLALARRLGCTPDDAAAQPHRDEPVQVWRHPAPAEVAA
ncbi:GNAT family N-acetyltransferase [Roseibacterium sp. SDUM158017]|uniref:GNAT family N-acetyltransferase n=1 Tax=Roseicyclus salinarum TaxID=3036773 RepID=UPI00241563DC|nr:GNAT family N-acetyltransferase [Roseibacterium sp. SDUM158017]MDG4649509.1 GNAT family N-acetyltransferase [Roseibacterium sp. SDUM158017]